MEDANVIDNKDFWDWLQKQEGLQKEKSAYIEATLELPTPPARDKKTPEPSNNSIWTDVNFVIYEL